MHNAHRRLIWSLTLRYTLVLIALGILMTSNFLLLQRQIELGAADSAIINTSGRQRMLSQRTALLAQQIAISTEQQKLAEMYAALREAHSQLDVTHEQLLGDNSATQHGENLSDALHPLYFDSPADLDRRYHIYADLLHTLLATPLTDTQTLQKLARQITDIGVEGTLLIQLDEAVQLHLQDSQKNLRRINQQQRWIWLAALITLMYSAFGIFRPMAHRIRSELTALNDIKRTLVLRVAEQTREVRRMAQAMQASAEAILITDTNGIIQYVNQACLALNGYTEAEMVGEHTRMFRGATTSADGYGDLWPTIREGKIWVGDVVNARKDGSHYNAHLTIAPIRNDDGSIDGYVGIQSDITTIKQTEKRLQTANQELDRLATEDALTGIANRRVFDSSLEEEWARARRAKSPLALIMIDIDFFKAYNDSFGHQQGDVCLQQVTQALADSLSRPGDRAARYGGEEFAVLLPNTTATGAIEVAEAIRQKITALNIPAANTTVSPYVSISLGVASTIPQHKQNAAELLNLADKALYQAKRSGRDRVAAAK